MKKMKAFSLTMLMLIIVNAVFAQTREITGKVTNANNGDPLPDVTILADKKVSSVKVNENGTFTIKVDAKATNLIFSYVGFTTQTVEIAGRNKIDVALKPSASALDEVVVVGYGTQKKSSVTGAVAKYTNEKMDEAPVSRLDQALQGRLAGVTVQNLSPEAGADTRVRIRGISSINAGADPLVVVDGHPVPDGLAYVNMADVQSVEVLKDAASAAIYGSRGANGVILITTKSGKADKPKYSVKLSSGVKSAYKLQDMMTASQYVTKLFAEAALRANDPSVPANQVNRITTAERAYYIIENQVMGGMATDWQKEAIRDAGMSNVQLSVSGGKKDVKYYFSGGYQKDDAMIYHSSYEKINVRGKLETQLGSNVKFNLNLNPSFTKRERPSTGYIDFVRFPSYMPARHTDSSAAFVNQVTQWANIRPGDWAQAAHFNGRIYSGLMPDGSTWTNTSAITPFSTSNNNPKSVLETRSINVNEYRMMTSGDVNVKILPGLDFKSTGSVYVTYAEGLDFAQRNSNRQGDVNRATFTTNLFIDLLNENTLNYTKSFGGHSINALAGFTAQKSKRKLSSLVGTDFPSDNIVTINNALQIVAPSGSGSNYTGSYTLVNPVGLLSYLGRIQYDYKSKYLLMASFRADGSSRFAPDHKWGTFPSVSLGWVASKEKFLQNVKWMSQFKLRGSYGATGNNNIPDFLWAEQLFLSNTAFGTGTGTVAPGFIPARDYLANENITWERTFQYNLGADISLFRNAVTLSVDAYRSQSEALLLQQAVMGFTGATYTWNNIGKLRNNGLEVEVSSNNIRSKNFSWTTSANFSRNRNKLVEFGGENFQMNTGERNEVYRAQVGSPLVRFWGYKTDGVWLSQADADAARAKDQGTSNAAVYYTAGGLKLVDINGDGKIDTDDRTEIGNPLPKFTWGFNNSFSYKSFDLSFLFQGVQGVDVINGDLFYNETRRFNNKVNTPDRWVSALNPGDGKTPYFTSGYDWMLTDYVVEDGSYFALREVNLGYKLPQKFAKAAKLNGVRFYVTAQNLYFHFANGYRGINPEARSTSGNYASSLVDGYQRGSFPLPRTVLFGVDLNF